MIEQILKLMGFSRNTYFNWKKENRPIVNLVQKYFSEEDITEFIETGDISKYHSLNKYQQNIEFKFASTFEHIEDSLDFEGLYYFIKFCRKNNEEILKKLLDYNPKLNLFRPTSYNVALQRKLNDFLIEEKIYENNLIHDYSELQVFLYELSYEVKIYLFQSFKTDFKYVKDNAIREFYNHLKDCDTLEKFHSKYIQLRQQ